MYKQTSAIGLLGGTFDPIHHGHLRMALELQSLLHLDRIHLTPCFEPVHRKRPIASPSQRLAMIKCAIQDEPSLIADDREIKRGSPSYTIDTLLDLRQDYPTTPIAILLGIDAFLSFLSWHRYRDLLAHAHIVIAHRPHYQLPETGEIATLIRDTLQVNPDYLHQHASGGIFLQPITPLEISATDIRKLITMGKNPRYLLPNAVYDYINEHKIYSLSRKIP